MIYILNPRWGKCTTKRTASSRPSSGPGGHTQIGYVLVEYVTPPRARNSMKQVCLERAAEPRSFLTSLCTRGGGHRHEMARCPTKVWQPDDWRRLSDKNGEPNEDSVKSEVYGSVHWFFKPSPDPRTNSLSASTRSTTS